MSESLETQVRDKLQSAALFVWGDERPPETGTIVPPAESQMYDSVLRQEVKGCLLLLAREIDALKAAAGD